MQFFVLHRPAGMFCSIGHVNPLTNLLEIPNDAYVTQSNSDWLLNATQ